MHAVHVRTCPPGLNEVKVSSKHFSEGGSCACFFDWVGGQDGRTLFGEVVD